jgi:hypothetical protein
MAMFTLKKWRILSLECCEVEQISPDIIERSVQSVGECQMVGGGQFQHLR